MVQEQWGKRAWRDACSVLGYRMRQEAAGSRKGVRLWLGPPKGVGKGGGCGWTERCYRKGSVSGQSGLGVKIEVPVGCDNS